MKAVLAAAALLALVAGCAAPDAGAAAEEPATHASFDPAKCSGHWHVDVASFAALAPQLLGELDATVASWERFSGRPGSLVLSSDHAPSCVVRAVLARDWAPPTEAGLYDPATGDVTIVVDLMPSCVDAPAWAGPCLGPLLLHELGHGMGVGHLPAGESGIMNAHTMSSFWSAADRRACVTAGACETR